MAVTVSGTSITFNDNTVQTTAAAAPTTSTVLAATAGAAVGAVGSYALLSRVDTGSNPGSLQPGGTDSGSNLRYAAVIGSSTTAPAGTWRCMGFATVQSYQPDYSPVLYYRAATVYLRIS